MINGVDTRSLGRYLDRFREVKVLVIGDLILDHYIWGKVSRISPEAPVPVVDVTSESFMLGGAANVLNNILSLGGHADICGVVGHDEPGRMIIHELRGKGILTEGVTVEDKRPTTKKTRIIANSQQVVRFDTEKREKVSKDTQTTMINYIRERIGQYKAIIISDYAKGVITQELIKELSNMSDLRAVKIVADPKPKHFKYYRDVNVITPNSHEASLASGIEIEDDDTLYRAGKRLLEVLNNEAVLITRGEHGMSLFERDGNISHIQTTAKEVFDVTGAGDTVVGVFALSIAAGASMVEAAIIANHAAGIVVGTIGATPIDRSSLEKGLKELERQ